VWSKLVRGLINPSRPPFEKERRSPPLSKGDEGDLKYPSLKGRELYKDKTSKGLV